MRRVLVTGVAGAVLASSAVMSAGAFAAPGGHGGGKAGKTIAFSTADNIAYETDGTAYVAVVRSWKSGTASVTFATNTDGTAVDGVDYTSMSNYTVNFARNQTTVQVPIEIIDDGVADETTAPTVGLDLSNPAGAKGVTLGSPSASTLSIRDDDAPAAPTSLVASPGSNPGDIDLSWTGSSGAVWYDVYSTDSNGENGYYLDYTSDPTTTYTVTGLDTNTTYYFIVYAYSLYSSYSDPSSVASAMPAVPDPAGVFVIPAGSTINVSNRVIGGCDPLAGAIVTSTGADVSVGSYTDGCEGTGFDDTSTVSWTNDGTDPVTARILLRDSSCYGADQLFYSDGTSSWEYGTGSVDHAEVTGTDPLHVAITDGGGNCEWTTREPDPTGNLEADVTITAGP